MKLFWKLVIGASIFGALIFGYRKYEAAIAAKAVAELQLVKQRAINDSTEARMTVEHADKDSLAAALKAAHDLNGKLIAAVKLHVSKRDTTIVHDTLHTTTESDSTRTATFKDSTFAGTISGTVIAPPCCTALIMDSLHVDRPAFDPTISFVKVGNKTIATVTWRGEKVDINAPFAASPAKKLKLFGYYAEMKYNIIDKNFAAAIGPSLRLPAFIQLNGEINTDKKAYIVIRKDF